jgi:hypothetical protein
MRYRGFASAGAVAVAGAVVALAAVTVDGQTRTGTSATTGSTWKVPRTVDGQPDLQGVWANNNITPLERPKQWAGKAVLSEQEFAEIQKVTQEIVANDGDAQFGDGLILAAIDKIKNPGSYDPATGNYNQFWLVERDFVDRRTSLITDPPDGRIPAMLPEAEKRMAAATEYRQKHPADGPEDRPAGERCVNFGLPKLGAGYNSYYQLFQTKDHVVILSEMAHDARVIPLDGRPHVGKSIQQWNGDARGRWEGDTLVIETKNFSSQSEFGSGSNLTLTERYSRVGPNTLNYEVTIKDPSTWSKPWTVMIPLQAKSEKIYEYACHEGNEGMFGILAGHRAEEAAESAPKVKPTTSGGGSR